MKTYLSYERSGFEGHGAMRVTCIQVEKAILRSEHEPCQTATATATAQLCEGAVYNDGAMDGRHVNETIKRSSCLENQSIEKYSKVQQSIVTYSKV
jgi:hypothetical protein